MTPVIRLGVPADAAVLAELAARTFSDTFAADNRPEDMAAHEVEAYGPLIQGRELRDPHITTLIAEMGSELAGYAQIRRDPPPDCVKGDKPIELWRFYITTNWHGRGIAAALMAAVDGEARRAGDAPCGSACGNATTARKRFTGNPASPMSARSSSSSAPMFRPNG